MSHTNEQRTPDTVRRSDGAGKERVTTGTAADSRELMAELFVRSLSPAGARPQQTAVFERLDQLVHNDRLTTCTVTVWGTGICLDRAVAETDAGQAILETVEEFRQWADRENLLFDAGFEERTASSIGTEEEATVIEFPAMCLAIRDAGDGALRCIAPCSDTDGEMRHSINDCLDELEEEVEAPDHDWPPVSLAAD